LNFTRAFIDNVNPIPLAAAAKSVLCAFGVNQGGDGSTAANSGTSCATLQTHFGKGPGRYFIGAVLTNCFFTTLSSCQHAINLIPGLPSGVYTLTANNYQSWCEFENGNGWTLILKAHNSGNFHYDNALWYNTASFNEGSVTAGLDGQEYKSPLYWQLPFSQVRVGMSGSRSGNKINWGVFAYSASHLHACIADGNTRGISFDRNQWKAVVGSGSLQSNCNRSGFNIRDDCGYGMGQRLGIFGNNEGECCSPDSRIGFGGKGSNCGVDGSMYTGNGATCGADNGEFNYKANGYIMVR